MLEINKNSFKTKEFKILFSNFFSLLIIQILNVLLPFLTIPYLINKLGIENFGFLTFIHSIVLFGVVFVEYGFNMSSTREISINSNNNKEVERIYSEVISTKFFLLFISLIVYSVLTICLQNNKREILIYLLYFGIILGQTLFSQWLFQGLQKMKYVTYVNVFFKTIFTVCTFIFVENVEDIWMVPLFLSLGSIFSGIGSMIIIRYVLKIHYKTPKFQSIILQLRSGYNLFLAEFYMAVLSYSNVIILGFVADNSSVGIYSSAEKVIRASAGLLSPVINAIYPHVTRLIYENYNKGISYIEKVRKIGVLIIIIGSIVVFVFADFLFYIIYHNKNSMSLNQSILAFRIMIIFPLVSFLDQVYGKLILIVLGRSDVFFRIFSICSVMNIVFCFILSYYFGYVGTAISSSLSQIIIAFTMYFYAKNITSQYLEKK